jgi:hypothetical protein
MTRLAESLQQSEQCCSEPMHRPDRRRWTAAASRSLEIAFLARSEQLTLRSTATLPLYNSNKLSIWSITFLWGQS